MISFNKVLTFGMLAYLSTSAYSFQQTIRLHVKSVDNPPMYQGHVQTAIKSTCFMTTDFFSRKHCGDLASHHYKNGPKNWRITSQLGGIVPDISCEPYFEINRTPESDGTLDIYGEIASYTDVAVLKNCRMTWN